MVTELGKPIEIEGVFDLHFYTPLGGVIAHKLSATSITPNQVSCASVVVAGAAAATYLIPTLAAAITAAILLLASGILDSADGQLARFTGRTSEFGETLDGFCDTLSFGLIYLAAAIGFVAHGGSAVLIAIMMVAAGWSHSVQSSLVDFERQAFVYIVTGAGRVQREDPADLELARQRARIEGEHWWPRWLRAMHIVYCQRQRRWLSSTTALLALYQGRLADAPSDQRRWFAERYRAKTRLLLKNWAVLAPNSHTLGILLAGFAPFLCTGAMARWGLALVFLFDLSLNVPMLALILIQRRVDDGLVRALADRFDDEGGLHALGAAQ